MFKIFSNTLLFLFLFVAVGFSIFRDPIYEATADKCSAEYQTWKISNLNDDLENRERLSEKRLKGLVQFENALDKLHNGDTPEMRNLFLSYVLLKMNNCPVPKDVEYKINKAVLPTEHAGDRICPVSAYYKESMRELNDIKYNQKPTYEYLLNITYKELMSVSENSETAALIEKSWASQDFKDRILIAALQITKRKKNQCRDINLPMTNIVREFMDYAIKTIQQRKQSK